MGKKLRKPISFKEQKHRRKAKDRFVGVQEVIISSGKREYVASCSDPRDGRSWQCGSYATADAAARAADQASLVLGLPVEKNYGRKAYTKGELDAMRQFLEQQQRQPPEHAAAKDKHAKVARAGIRHGKDTSSNSSRDQQQGSGARDRKAQKRKSPPQHTGHLGLLLLLQDGPTEPLVTAAAMARQKPAEKKLVNNEKHAPCSAAQHAAAAPPPPAAPAPPAAPTAPATAAASGAATEAIGRAPAPHKRKRAAAAEQATAPAAPATAAASGAATKATGQAPAPHKRKYAAAAKQGVAGAGGQQAAAVPVPASPAAAAAATATRTALQGLVLQPAAPVQAGCSDSTAVLLQQLRSALAAHQAAKRQLAAALEALEVCEAQLAAVAQAAGLK